MARLDTETMDPKDFLLFAQAAQATAPVPADLLDFEAVMDTTNNGNPVVWIAKTLPSELYGGHHFRYRGGSGNVLTTDVINSWKSDATLLAQARVNAGNDKLELLVNGAVVAIGTENIQINRNYHMQWRYKNSATVGVFEVKLDEDLDVLTFSGNTKNAGAAWVNRVEFAASNNGTYFDSIYINDTSGAENNGYDGVVKMLSFVPTADDLAAWLLKTGVNGFAMLNQTPHDSDLTYIYSNVNGDKSSFICPGHGLAAPSEIKAVSARWVVRKVSDGRVRPFFRIGGVEYPIAAASVPVGVGYMVVTDRRTTNPDTGLPWALGDTIDSFGLESIL